MQDIFLQQCYALFVPEDLLRVDYSAVEIYTTGVQ